MNWQSSRAENWLAVDYRVRNKSLKTVIAICATLLLAGCFESPPPILETDAEFQLACVKLLEQNGAKGFVQISSPDIVPTCKCLIENVHKDDDPAFQLRIRKATIEANGDRKLAEAKIKSFLNSLANNSLAYKIEKSKIEKLDDPSNICRAN
jgi:hypothetical protein